MLVTKFLENPRLDLLPSVRILRPRHEIWGPSPQMSLQPGKFEIKQWRTLGKIGYFKSVQISNIGICGTSTCSHNVAAIIISTPREAPGTLQKEWAGFLGVDPHSNHLTIVAKSARYGLKLTNVTSLQMCSLWLLPDSGRFGRLLNEFF